MKAKKELCVCILYFVGMVVQYWERGKHFPHWFCIAIETEFPKYTHSVWIKESPELWLLMIIECVKRHIARMIYEIENRFFFNNPAGKQLVTLLTVSTCRRGFHDDNFPQPDLIIPTKISVCFFSFVTSCFHPTKVFFYIKTSNVSAFSKVCASIFILYNSLAWLVIVCRCLMVVFQCHYNHQ